MKTSTLPVCVLALLAFSFGHVTRSHAQNEVPNGGFEIWTGDDPDQWSTSNTGAPQVNITASTDAFEGEFSVRGEVFSNATPVLATTDRFPISQSYDYLIGYYKLSPLGEGDRLRITGNLFNDDPNEHSESFGEIELYDAADEWTLFVVPLDGEVVGSEIVGTIEIKLMNIPFPANGSVFHVDQLELTNSLPGTDPPDDPEPLELVISHEVTGARGWFGGDDLIQQRSVGGGQSVLIPSTMSVKRFSFYFEGPFDYASSTFPTGHAVTLVLNVRRANGAIISSHRKNVPETFTEGWVTWDDLDVPAEAGTTLIFTSYLEGAYDELQVRASQVADPDAGYADGVRFVKEGTSDAEMEEWSDWMMSPLWDFVFRLEGTPLELTPYGRMVLQTSISGVLAARLNETFGDPEWLDQLGAFDANGNGVPDLAFLAHDPQESGIHIALEGLTGNVGTVPLMKSGGDYYFWTDNGLALTDTGWVAPEGEIETIMPADRALVLGHVRMDSSPETYLVMAESPETYSNPVVVDLSGNLVSSWKDARELRLVSVRDADDDGMLEVLLYNETTKQIDVWELVPR